MELTKGQEEPWSNKNEVESLSLHFLSRPTKGRCSACDTYLGPTFDETLCPTCHDFLYTNVVDAADGTNDDDVDGSEESVDAIADAVGDIDVTEADIGLTVSYSSGNAVTCHNDFVTGSAAKRARHELFPISDKPETENKSETSFPGRRCHSKSQAVLVPPDLNVKYHHLGCGHLDQIVDPNDVRNDVDNSDLVGRLPPEVLMVIFSFLDDKSMYAVANVCNRWRQIVASQLNDKQWRLFTASRWPLFQPQAKVSDWFSAYSDLIESSSCRTCVYQGPILQNSFCP